MDNRDPNDIFETLKVNQDTDSVNKYKVKLFNVFQNAKVADPIFKRHIFTSGLNKDIKAKLELMPNTDYNTTIKNAKKCEKCVLLEQKIGENLVVRPVNSLASQLDKPAHETDSAIVQSNHAIRVLHERDNQKKALHRNVSSCNTPIRKVNSDHKGSLIVMCIHEIEVKTVMLHVEMVLCMGHKDILPLEGSMIAEDPVP